MTRTWAPWESVPELVRVYILGAPKMSFPLDYRVCTPGPFKRLVSEVEGPPAWFPPRASPRAL